MHHRLARSVLWTALLLATLTSGLLFVAEFKRASAKTQAMLEQLLDTVENTAAVAAYSGNLAIGEDVLRGLLRNDLVHAVRLDNGRGLDLRQARTTANHPAPAGTIRALTTPFGERETIGHLSVVPDAGFSLREALHGALLAALNSSVLIGLTALLVLARVRSSLSRPLARVSHALHAIKAGQRERLPELRRHGGDELGQLVDDINGLLATLEEKFAAECLLRADIQAVERRLRDIFENTSAGIFLLDEAGRLLTANPTLGRVLGFPDLESHALAGRDFPSLAFAEPDQFHNLIRHAGEAGRAVALDLRLNDPDHPSAWVHCLLSRRADSEGAILLEGVVYDITERRAQEMRVRHEADHDPLTGLLRRHAAERELRKLLAAPDGENPVLLLLDLDNFKAVNDSLGHDAGDAVLVETARRFKACVRTSDVVARLGGDEFLIALVDSLPLERVRGIARALVAATLEPIPLAGGTVARVGVSIGIAGRQATLEGWLKAADIAMYEVKRQGKNGFGLARPEGGIVVELPGREA